MTKTRENYKATKLFVFFYLQDSSIDIEQVCNINAGEVYIIQKNRQSHPVEMFIVHVNNIWCRF